MSVYVGLSVCLISIYLYLAIYIYLSVCVCLSVCLCVCLSVCLSDVGRSFPVVCSACTFSARPAPMTTADTGGGTLSLNPLVQLSGPVLTLRKRRKNATDALPDPHLTPTPPPPPPYISVLLKTGGGGGGLPQT